MGTATRRTTPRSARARRPCSGCAMGRMPATRGAGMAWRPSGCGSGLPMIDVRFAGDPRGGSHTTHWDRPAGGVHDHPCGQGSPQDLSGQSNAGRKPRGAANCTGSVKTLPLTIVRSGLMAGGRKPLGAAKVSSLAPADPCSSPKTSVRAIRTGRLVSSSTPTILSARSDMRLSLPRPTAETRSKRSLHGDPGPVPHPNRGILRRACNRNGVATIPRAIQATRATRVREPARPPRCVSACRACGRYPGRACAPSPMRHRGARLPS
jgi:hypothetical protein